MNGIKLSLRAGSVANDEAIPLLNGFWLWGIALEVTLPRSDRYVVGEMSLQKNI
jgi:hypothetical protein